jgi:subtilisin family serine protease
MKIKFYNYIKYPIISFLFLSCFVSAAAQTQYYFYVQFADKLNSPYSLSHPEAFLSVRAIERRAAFNITCDSTDLPVTPAYISQIENLGIHVHNASKWMNGVTVILSDSSKMNLVRALSFVRFVEYTGKLIGPVLSPQKRVNSNITTNYGIADTQISQLNGKVLHTQGYRGKGIEIAVIDAGFNNVDNNPAFDSLRLQGRLLGVKDIINPNSNIYTEDAHGANVLSIMTGNLPGQFLGTAPDASFWLIRTEYSPTEYKVETDFWCSGIEYADSVGADLATSSLGYYTFDDSIMNFSYADMTGKVSRASRAATLASKKGMVVLVAAGNEALYKWHYIGSPADADGIIAVGAVTSTGTPSSFSSFGPSYDGRVKPEICAMGTGTAIVDATGKTATGSGTSYATPAMAGLMACLLEKYKADYKSQNIPFFLNSVLQTGSLFNAPTAQMGYGIPDFEKSERNLQLYDSFRLVKQDHFNLIYNRIFHSLILRLPDSLMSAQNKVSIYSVTGELMLHKSITESPLTIRTDHFASGIYAVCITINGNSETRKIIIE